MAEASKELHLVLIAGEQIIPNLESALYYWREGADVRVHLLFTDDAARSRGPAERLAKLLNKLRATAPFANAGSIVVQLEDTPVGVAPQDVRQRIDRLIEADPAAHWVINVTGGLKLMAFAVAGLAPREAIEIIYLERGQGWFALDQDANGRMSGRKLRPSSGHLIDDIPIELLVGTQFADGASFRFEAEEKPAAIDMAEFVRNGVATGWVWADLVPKVQSGTAFEQFVAAGLKRMGITNIVRSLKIFPAQGGTSLHEMDIVACHNGVVGLLDLKLPKETDKKYEQIRVAAQASRAIGGISARAIMIRPSWSRDRDSTELAKTLGVALLDQDDAGCLFASIARYLGATLDANLTEADRILAEGKKRLGFALAEARTTVQRAALGVDDDILDVEKVIREVARLRRQNWVAVSDATGLCLWVFAPQPGAATVPFERLRTAAFDGVRIQISGTGGTMRVRWHRRPSSRRYVLESLALATGHDIDFAGVVAGP